MRGFTISLGFIIPTHESHKQTHTRSHVVLVGRIHHRILIAIVIAIVVVLCIASLHIIVHLRRHIRHHIRIRTIHIRHHVRLTRHVGVVVVVGRNGSHRVGQAAILLTLFLKR